MTDEKCMQKAREIAGIIQFCSIIEHQAEVIAAALSEAYRSGVEEERARLAKTATFLDWVADSYAAHAKCTDVPDEVDAYLGSAEMAREHATAIRKA